MNEQDTDTPTKPSEPSVNKEDFTNPAMEEKIFSAWLIERGSKFNISLLLPDNKNSQLGRACAEIFVESGFSLEVPVGMDKKEIDALFNYELSKEAKEHIIEKATELLKECNTMSDTISSSSFGSLSEEEQNDIKVSYEAVLG